jgi:hypothetical protein
LQNVEDEMIEIAVTDAMRVRAIQAVEKCGKGRGGHARLLEADVDGVRKIGPGNLSRRRDGNRGGDEHARHQINRNPS